MKIERVESLHADAGHRNFDFLENALLDPSRRR